jgi:glycosyltransferase involved in cell wall biosynthesis
VLHEHANLTSTPWFQKVADWTLKRYTDVAIAVSRSTAEFVIGARLVSPDRVKVVYLGAPLDEFGQPVTSEERIEARAALGIAPDDVVMGTVTRLHDSKGNQYLVDAARLVIDARPHARFFLFGEGPLLASLQQQAAALKLGNRFVFGGFVKDVRSALAAFDLSVFPSLWEGTPLTVFEALGAARPIVATDADGLIEVLTPDVDALIVPKRDARALADRIIRLIDAPAERTRLGAAARTTAETYDITAFVRKMERLYDILHRDSRAMRRRVTTRVDLSFLTGKGA